MNLGTAEVLRADSRNLPLADNSVDLIITSPPYFALRSYQDGGEHYDGQIGAEPTPDEFVSSLLEVTAECVRVLKPSGSLWVNLGDKYSGAPSGPRTPMGDGYVRDYETREFTTRRKVRQAVPNKSLIGIPWRYALRCIDDLGLILRAEVIWSKPNGLPESVTDRVRRSHEQWFHFTLQPRYFSAVDEIREPHIYAVPGRRNGPGAIPRDEGGMPAGDGSQHLDGNPLGKLPGSVWTVPTEPLRVPDHLGVDHFAAFPTEWPKRIIQGWSPAGVCVECGEGRRPVVAKETVVRAPGDVYAIGKQDRRVKEQQNRATRPNLLSEHTITGYACACEPQWLVECGCGSHSHLAEHHEGCSPPPDLRQVLPPTTPAAVLDPFGGTGTTAMVAKALGRHGISVDMSADYCRLAEWRTNDRDQLAKVLGIAKAEQQPDDQLSIFDLGEPA